MLRFWVVAKQLVLVSMIWLPISPAFASDGGKRIAGPLGHSQGNIQLTVGTGNIFGGLDIVDPITGDTILGCVYPRASAIRYITGQLHVGAIVAGDTLVSNPWEMGPLSGLHPTYLVRTQDVSQTYYTTTALSELDLITTYYDSTFESFQMVGWDRRKHIPMGLSIEQQSMAWSGAAIDDFVLIKFEITNVGLEHLEEVYVGIAAFCWAWHRDDETDQDNLLGFLPSHTAEGSCGYSDELNLAYVIDNDGNPVSGRFKPESPKAAVGVMVLGTSADSSTLNYNWWTGTNNLAESFGPRQASTLDDPFRQIGPFLGQPYKDANMYYLMRHPETDYDQLFTAVYHTNDGWMAPPQDGESIASGDWGQFMLSFGPFDLRKREHFSFTIAVVGGDNVHTDPYAYFDPYLPQPFYDQLDFSELVENARWAQWVYDNPGYDTDSDGYAGEFRICEGDTVWYKGDGVPDFRGNTPPPAPFTRFITEPGQIKIRWNGFLTETFKDPFSGLVDFEGYRVYAGLDTRRSSLSVLASYDKENFFRLKYHDLGFGNGKWLNDEPPYTLAELRTIHNDPAFDPLRYTRSYPLFEGDSTFYFQMVDANLNDLSSIHGIHKVYPDATNPGPDSTLWTDDDVTYDYAGRMLPKFYEYEFIHDNLLPTVPYFVAVTCFDFGYAGGRGNLPPDESNPLNNLTEVYAQTSADSVEAHELDVYVYPNPYRADADYHTRGYENRTGSIIPDRARLLHFANLPNVCKISIFSLDGDLIGEINHDFPEGGPEAMHDWWNLVSRSNLAVESGLYFYTVESATRTQIGKFAIIK